MSQKIFYIKNISHKEYYLLKPEKFIELFLRQRLWGEIFSLTKIEIFSTERNLLRIFD